MGYESFALGIALVVVLLAALPILALVAWLISEPFEVRKKQFKRLIKRLIKGPQ